MVLAAHSAFTEMVKFLLDEGADANAIGPGFTALHEAIMRRDERMVTALVAHGANPNTPLQTWTPERRSSADFNFAPSLVGATPSSAASSANSGIPASFSPASARLRPGRVEAAFELA